MCLNLLSIRKLSFLAFNLIFYFLFPKFGNASFANYSHALENPFSVKCENGLKNISISHQLDASEIQEGYVFHLMFNESLSHCIWKCCHHAGCGKLQLMKFHCFGYLLELKENLTHTWKYYGNGVSNTTELIVKLKVKKREVSSENFIPQTCILGLLHCHKNEFCKTKNNRSRNGICECKEGFSHSHDGICIDVQSFAETTFMPPTSSSSSSDHKTTDSSSVLLMASDKPTATETTPSQGEKITVGPSAATSSEPLKKLVVNINNKTVTLPDGVTHYKAWVTLSAYALGDIGSTFKYTWNLLDKPDNKGEGSIRNMNSQTVSISDLIAGVYIFKVSVTGKNSYGEATGNVTVLPAKHVNKVPVAVIVPMSQTVQLPSSGVILDGSGSSDDKKVESYQWELVMGPLGYKLKEEDGPTLQMTDLEPGNYTVMLKVKDEQGLEGNSTASVLIIKETDYPPNANAGGDKIIYLPQTEVTLNGNMSTDDHEIVEWEWTKGPEDSGNAVDMQDTRTPYLHLSNLEEGHYHFILKVMDTAGQLSNSSSHIYVHSASDNVLKANAGENKTLVIPITSVILDGSRSTGVSSQTKFLWKQLSGPSSARLSSPAQKKTNASELTRGDYLFRLTVWNSEGKLPNSSSVVLVTVVQDKNVAPVANAGVDFSVTLPSSVVIVNGSSSTDDIGIVRWLWQRDATSLAAGTVIQNSEKSPVLLFSNAVPGRYVWNLTVWDDQGAYSTDTVSIIVKEGPNYLDKVEITVGVSVENLSVSQLTILLQKLQLLLHNSTSDITFTLLNIEGRPMAGKVALIVLGNRSGKIMRGTSLVQELKEKTVTRYRDNILNLPILNVDTVICQNNCSGHGDCIQSTKECRCHSWWMESFWRRHFRPSVPNCDWSVVYVFVFAVGSVILVGLCTWLFYTILVKKIAIPRQKKTKSQQYSLLDPCEESIKGQTRLHNSLLDSATDSDTEPEIIFETRSSKSRMDKHKNGGLKFKLRA